MNNLTTEQAQERIQFGIDFFNWIDDNWDLVENAPTTGKVINILPPEQI